LRTDCSEETSPALKGERSSQGVSNRSLLSEAGVGVTGDGRKEHAARIKLRPRKEANSLFMD
jgi:hypothetical protein